MIPFKSVGVAQAREKINLELINWISGKEKILNIISIPYNSAMIFTDIILNIISENKRILYITEENERNINIIECIKKGSSFRDYSYLRKNNSRLNTATHLLISNYERALQIDINYDYVIYDDIGSFPKYSKFEILELLATYYKNGSRIVCRSIEPIFQNARIIDIPIKDSRTPIAEPRIITTRIDVNKDIPYVAYEYLVWSIKSDRKVIIYVPDEERAENVYKYLINLRDSLHNNIMYFKNIDDLKLLQNFIKNKKGIIIMDCMNELDVDFKDTDIMVYFADDRVFDYKKLIYFCGKVGRTSDSGSGEVVFLARESTKDMEIAKDIARSFNKQAWELGLLNI
jgi:late competence protein required for DNA uptake (superfamily II DNA/RNA helicase)